MYFGEHLNILSKDVDVGKLSDPDEILIYKELGIYNWPLKRIYDYVYEMLLEWSKYGIQEMV